MSKIFEDERSEPWRDGSPIDIPPEEPWDKHWCVDDVTRSPVLEWFVKDNCSKLFFIAFFLLAFYFIIW